MKIDILAVGVHPDDVELSCSGTLLRQIAMGKTAGLLDLTKGELGTRGSAEIRTKEAMESARLMGALFREQLDLADGFFAVERENILKIAAALRRYRPEIVLCNALDDRHPDHGRAAKLTADACFYSGLAKIATTDADGSAQAPWRPKWVYHYIQDRFLKPDFVVDITPYIEQKHELVMAFRSQFYDPESKEPLTPISGKDFINALRGKDSVMGRAAGVDFAEGFNAQRAPLVKNLFDLA